MLDEASGPRGVTLAPPALDPAGGPADVTVAPPALDPAIGLEAATGLRMADSKQALSSFLDAIDKPSSWVLPAVG